MALKDKWIEKVDRVDIASAGDINLVAQAVIELEENGGVQGADGATFIPNVSYDGIISWTNDRDLPNPEPVNIKGEKGDKGDRGEKGDTGEPFENLGQIEEENLSQVLDYVFQDGLYKFTVPGDGGVKTTFLIVNGNDTQGGGCRQTLIESDGSIKYRICAYKSEVWSDFVPYTTKDELDLKANAADVYTKSETDAKVSAVTYWGGNVSSVSQLPSSPKAGTYCYVMDDISNGVKYTGRVGDLFSCDGGDLWSYTLMFTPPSKCVYTEPDVTVNPSYTFIYNESGTRLGSISIDPTEMPGAFDASLLGVTSVDDTVTFYLGIHNNGTFPAQIYNFKAGEMIFWNGSMWCAVPPYSAIEEINSTLNLKADKASTLSGYGITDAYSKYAVDAKDDILKADILAIKQKSIPHTSVSEYPVSISDHLENEEVINYRIYGNSVQSETPSVDNPVEVQSVGDLVTDSKSEYYGKYDVPVTICGKNLFDMDTVLPKQGWVKQDDGSYYTASNATINRDIALWENIENYTGQLKILYQFKWLKSSTESSGGMYIMIYYTDGTYTSVFLNSGKWEADTWYYPTASYTITTSGKTIKNIAWKYGTGANSSWVKDIIITKDTTVTEYEPYVGETKHLYLNEPLRKVGDYADYIDFENQKVVRNVGETTFNGTEEWAKTSDFSSDEYQGFAVSNSVYNIPGYDLFCLSDKFPYSHIVTKNTVKMDKSRYSLRIIIGVEYVSDLSVGTFKTWLSTNNVKITYPIATPTEESITIPELTALNSEVMNVFSSTATPPSSIDFLYYQDINKVIAELKNAILSQGGDV